MGKPLYLTTEKVSSWMLVDCGYFLLLNRLAKYKAFFRIKSTNSQSLILLDYITEFLSFTDYFSIKRGMDDIAAARNETTGITMVIIKNYCCRINQTEKLASEFKDWLTIVKSGDNIHECIETFNRYYRNEVFLLPNQSSHDPKEGIYKICKGKAIDFLIQDITFCI